MNKGKMRTVISSGGYRSRLMQGPTVSCQCRTLYNRLRRRRKGVKKTITEYEPGSKAIDAIRKYPRAAKPGEK